jgi:hypothetical protein
MEFDIRIDAGGGAPPPDSHAGARREYGGRGRGRGRGVRTEETFIASAAAAESRIAAASVRH